jgi:rubrerythrin
MNGFNGKIKVCFSDTKFNVKREYNVDIAVGALSSKDVFDTCAKCENKYNEFIYAELYNEDGELIMRQTELYVPPKHFEWDKMYREFAETAKEEGFDEIAGRFERVAAIERRHEERYLKYQKQLADGNAFVKTEEDGNTPWICLACGQLIANENAPEHCPTCGHPRAYFARFSE